MTHFFASPVLDLDLHHSLSLQQAFCLKTWPSWTVPHQYVDVDFQLAAETSHTAVVL